MLPRIRKNKNCTVKGFFSMKSSLPLTKKVNNHSKTVCSLLFIKPGFPPLTALGKRHGQDVLSEIVILFSTRSFSRMH